MKILHVNDYREGGGAEVVIARTIELQRDRGHEVELFTIDDVPGHKRTWRTYGRNKRAVRALREWTHAFAPGVVHIHNYYHELSPAILEPFDRKQRPVQCRVVMTAHDYHLVCPSAGGYVVNGERLQPVDPLICMTRRQLFSHDWDHRGLAINGMKSMQHFGSYIQNRRHHIPDVIMCPSIGLQRALQVRDLNAAHMPYPAPAFAPTRDRPDTLTIVFAGRLEREKGLAECLEIWPRDFNARLRVVGDGSERARCEQIVQHRGMAMEVEFIGQVAHEQAVREIGRAHVLLLPTRCIEVSPLSVHEAMSMGTNFFVPDHGGCAEIVETSGIGFRFALDEPQSLAASLDGIRTSFDRGDLNSFDAGAYLAARSESVYIDRLQRIYAGQDLPDVDVPSESATLHR